MARIAVDELLKDRHYEIHTIADVRGLRTPLNTQVWTVLNFFQLCAVQFHLKMVDGPLLRTYLGSYIVHWNKALVSDIWAALDKNGNAYAPDVDGYWKELLAYVMEAKESAHWVRIADSDIDPYRDRASPESVAHAKRMRPAQPGAGDSPTNPTVPPPSTAPEHES